MDGNNITDTERLTARVAELEAELNAYKTVLHNWETESVPRPRAPSLIRRDVADLMKKWRAENG